MRTTKRYCGRKHFVWLNHFPVLCLQEKSCFLVSFDGSKKTNPNFRSEPILLEIFRESFFEIVDGQDHLLLHNRPQSTTNSILYTHQLELQTRPRRHNHSRQHSEYMKRRSGGSPGVSLSPLLVAALVEFCCSRCHAFATRNIRTATSLANANASLITSRVRSSEGLVRDDKRTQEIQNLVQVGQRELQRLYDFPLDDWQLLAGGAIWEGHNVIVSAPTGAGK